MKIDAQSYEQMKAWFARMVAETMLAEHVTPAAHPVASLEAIEAESPAKARSGLEMAISDIIELTDTLPDETVRKLDEQLADDGLPTLSVVRVLFSKAISRVLKRGAIRSEVEYHAVRNAAELATDGRDALWPLLSAYEQAAVR